MLLDFTVGNFGPFRDDMTLSLHATSVSEHPNNIVETNPNGYDLLSSVIVFGANASGKSYLTEALYVMKRVVQSVDDDSVIQMCYVPYRFNSECRESPVRMRIRQILDGVLYDYSVWFTSSEITHESLHHYPNGRRARIFERTGVNEYKGARKRVAAMTTSTRTYLAMAAMGGDVECSKVRNAIVNGIIVLPSDLDVLVQDSCRFTIDDSDRKAKTIRALNTADLGICDFTYNEREIKLADVKRKLTAEQYERIQSEAEATMALESAGTNCMFGLTGPLIDALENGKVLVMDELGAHLHPMLTRWIVRQFSSEYNPNGAQLIANTHDISLMDIEELLRRDQIWFVNKSRMDGASELYCLLDFDGVRKNTDVMRRYLDGRFNAVPAVRHRGVVD